MAEISDPQNDRDALLYILQQYEGEVHVCDRCGHEESTKGYDTAHFLRRYLKENPDPNYG